MIELVAADFVCNKCCDCPKSAVCQLCVSGQHTRTWQKHARASRLGLRGGIQRVRAFVTSSLPPKCSRSYVSRMWQGICLVSGLQMLFARAFHHDGPLVARIVPTSLRDGKVASVCHPWQISRLSVLRKGSCGTPLLRGRSNGPRGVFIFVWSAAK